MNRVTRIAWTLLVAPASLLAQTPPSECGASEGAPLAPDSTRVAVHLLLTDTNASVRHSAAVLLARVRFLGPRQEARPRTPSDKDPRQALTSALDDTDGRVRVAAACALARIGDPRTLPALDRHAAGGAAAMRAVARWAAGQVRGRNPLPLLVRDATVVDGTGGVPRPGTSVLIEGNVITWIGRFGTFPIPEGTRILEADGRWLTPGLWDMHVHLGKAGGSALSLLVAAGITGVRDMGGDPAALMPLRERIAAGDILGPRIVLAGPMLEAPATLDRMSQSPTWEPYRRTRVAVPAPSDARRVVDSLAALGVDFIKIRETANLDSYRAIVTAALANHLAVSGHAPFGMPPLEGVRLGLTTLEHASYPYPLDTVPEARARLLRAMRAGGAAMVPTMVAWSSYLMDPDSIAVFTANDGGHDARRPLLADTLIQEWRFDLEGRNRRSDESLRGWCGFVRQTFHDLRAIGAAGVPILAGSDLGVLGLVPGWSLHDELELLVRHGGLTPGAAIHAATGLAARFAGRGDEVGTIEVGKRADLLLLAADPTTDIRALRTLETVVLDGRLLDSEALADLRRGVSLGYHGHNFLPRITGAGCPALQPE